MQIKIAKVEIVFNILTFHLEDNYSIGIKAEEYSDELLKELITAHLNRMKQSPDTTKAREKENKIFDAETQEFKEAK